MKSQILVSLLSLISTVVAHGGAIWYNIGDTVYNGYLWKTEDGSGNVIPDPEVPVPSIQRRWHYWPITDYTSPNMTCNYDGINTPSSLHAIIAAGDNITAHYENPIPNVFPDAWHHGDGPLLSYMAACPGESCEGWDPSGAVWFKIDQTGLRPEAQDLRGPWIQSYTILQQAPGKPGYTATIPKNLKPGNYLLRTEVIMMAGEPAQIYPECAQLTVTGEGTAFPTEEYLVSFPGAYAATDPGLAIARFTMTPGGTYNFGVPDMWLGTDYPFPGPALWTGE